MLPTREGGGADGGGEEGGGTIDHGAQILEARNKGGAAEVMVMAGASVRVSGQPGAVVVVLVLGGPAGLILLAAVAGGIAGVCPVVSAVVSASEH